MLVYTARYLLPVSSPLVRDGAVAIDAERIVQAGPLAKVLESVGEAAEVRELGEVVLLPGLINAHTHLELSWLGRDPLPTGDYAGWLAELLKRRDGADVEAARSAAEESLRQMTARGTVAVADVANDSWIAPLIARSAMHGIVFHELYGLYSDGAEAALEQAAQSLESWGADPDVAAAGDRLRIALTPHAPHTTSTPLLRALAGRSAACGDPLTIHVAESEAEVALLRDGSGPLVELYRELDFWDPQWKPPAASPVGHLHRLGLFSPRTLAVHCVHLDAQDHSLLQAGRVTVVTCPRSNRWLGVGIAPIPRLLKAGVPVALGTDSLASNDNLDLFAEMAALREAHPELAPAAILRMATLNGARALGIEARLGSIDAGKLALLNVVPLADPEQKPFEAVCSNPADVYRLADAPWEPAS
jgi:cytosine/adenosine deaminase-related metal-dependent hydrolase